MARRPLRRSNPREEPSALAAHLGCVRGAARARKGEGCPYRDQQVVGTYEEISFTFCGYTFRPRKAYNQRTGEVFTGFLPAVSSEKLTAMSRRVGSWRIHRRVNLDPRDLAAPINQRAAGLARILHRVLPDRGDPTLPAHRSPSGALGEVEVQTTSPQPQEGTSVAAIEEAALRGATWSRSTPGWLPLAGHRAGPGTPADLSGSPPRLLCTGRRWSGASSTRTCGSVTTLSAGTRAVCSPLLRPRRPGGARQARPSGGPGPRHRLDPARGPRPRPRPGRRRPVGRLRRAGPEVTHG